MYMYVYIYIYVDDTLCLFDAFLLQDWLHFWLVR